MFAVTAAAVTARRQWLKSLGLLAACPSRVPLLSAYAYQRSVSLLLATSGKSFRVSTKLGQSQVKGDKIVAFCDRNCNIIAPFVSAPGNRNESPLLRDALPRVMRIAQVVGLELQGTM